MNAAPDPAEESPCRIADPLEERRAIDLFTDCLGWPRLRLQEDSFPDGRSLHWFERRLGAVSYQLNVLPPYSAAVHAISYRILTGFHRVRLTPDEAEVRAEARRVAGVLAAPWFASERSRRAFRALNPECAGWSWRRLREEGYPYI